MQPPLKIIRKKLASFGAAILGKEKRQEADYENGNSLKFYDVNDPISLLGALRDPQAIPEVGFTAIALTRMLEGLRKREIVIFADGIGGPSDKQWPSMGAEEVFLLAFKSGIFKDEELLKEGLAFEFQPNRAGYREMSPFEQEVQGVLADIIKGSDIGPKSLREAVAFTPSSSRWALQKAAKSPRQEIRRAARMLSLPLEEKMDAGLLKRISEADDTIYDTFLVLLKDEEEACQGLSDRLTQAKVECRFEQAQALS